MFDFKVDQQKALNWKEAKIKKYESQIEFVRKKEALMGQWNLFDEIVATQELKDYDCLWLLQLKNKIEKNIKQKEEEIRSLSPDEEAVLTKRKQQIEDLKARYQNAKEKEIYKIKYTVAKLTHKIKQVNDRYEWLILPTEEKHDVLTGITFYKTDSFGYWFLLLAVALEVIYIIVALSVMPREYLLGIMILFNIAVLLFLFTAALKVKNYVKQFSIASIAYGVYNVLRIVVVVPFILKINYSAIAFSKSFWIIFTLAVSSLICILVGIKSYRQILRKEKYKSEGRISFKQMSR